MGTIFVTECLRKWDFFNISNLKEKYYNLGLAFVVLSTLPKA
jgi:hypothetical protein